MVKPTYEVIKIGPAENKTLEKARLTTKDVTTPERKTSLWAYKEHAY